MATYYVRIGGSDSNNGTSPATAWRTFTKLLGASGMASGDVAYVGAGVYRETVSVGMTAPTVETKIVGDVDGSRTGDAGEVRLTNYTAGDTSAPASGTLLKLNGTPFLTFQRLVTHVGGTANVVDLGTAHDLTLRDCALIALRGGAYGVNVYHTSVAGQASNLLFDRCWLLNSTGLNVSFLEVVVALGAADYDLNILFQNCVGLFASYPAIRVLQTTGTGTGKAGGVRLNGCTFFGDDAVLHVEPAAHGTTYPSSVTGCLLSTGASTTIAAFGGGLVTEDYNRFVGTSARQNVAAGAHSVSDASQAVLFHLGQEAIWGAPLRPPFTPVAGSPLLGFGDDGTAPGVDLLNRPRPAGGQSTLKAVGALERHDTGTQASSPVHGTTTHSLQLAGPADHEFLLPVDAVAQTPSIWAQYDANYGGGTLPQAILTNGGQVGVADQTLTMTAVGSGTWQQLTFSSFTPTAKGYVTIRLVSAAAATGNAYFGDASP